MGRGVYLHGKEEDPVLVSRQTIRPPAAVVCVCVRLRRYHTYTSSGKRGRLAGWFGTVKSG